MAEYKGIKGFKVQYLSADPSNPIIGQTWYNSTSKDLKFTEFAAAAWATGNNMNTARGRLGSAGTVNAALAFAGTTSPGPDSNATEEYDGSTWTSVTNMPVSIREVGYSGTETAALSIGGYNGGIVGNTYQYDGSTWTTGGSLGTTRRDSSAAGT